MLRLTLAILAAAAPVRAVEERVARRMEGRPAAMPVEAEEEGRVLATAEAALAGAPPAAEHPDRPAPVPAVPPAPRGKEGHRVQEVHRRARVDRVAPVERAPAPTRAVWMEATPADLPVAQRRLISFPTSKKAKASWSRKGGAMAPGTRLPT